MGRVEMRQQAAAPGGLHLLEDDLDLRRAFLRAEDRLVQAEASGAIVVEADFVLGHACSRRKALPMT